MGKFCNFKLIYSWPLYLTNLSYRDRLDHATMIYDKSFKCDNFNSQFKILKQNFIVFPIVFYMQYQIWNLFHYHTRNKIIFIYIINSIS
jgi:hypothetical protein